MKTIPDIINARFSRLSQSWDSSLTAQKFRDKTCFIIGHDQMYLSGSGYICRRCNRRLGNNKDEFYHNWEGDYGKNARCHDHSHNQ